LDSGPNFGLAPGKKAAFLPDGRIFEQGRIIIPSVPPSRASIHRALFYSTTVQEKKQGGILKKDNLLFLRFFKKVIDKRMKMW